jgi:hypothetical protein
LIDLRVGDRAYGRVLSHLGDIDTTLQGGPFPSIALGPAEDEALYEPRDLARRMFLAESIAPVDDIAVSDLKLEPGPVGVRDGLPVSRSHPVAQVVVTNRGNVDVTGYGAVRLVSTRRVVRREDVPGLEATSSTLLTSPPRRSVTYGHHLLGCRR